MWLEMVLCIKCQSDMEFAYWQGAYMMYRCPGCGAIRLRTDEVAERMYEKLQS